MDRPIVIPGIEDGRAETVLGRDAWAAYERRPPIQSSGTCRICQLLDTPLIAGRCFRCAEAHEWSGQNRRWCDFVHRGIAP